MSNLEKTVTNDETAEAVNTKSYTLRELRDEDIYPVVNIIATVLTDEAKEAFTQAVNGKSVDELGSMVAFDLLKMVLKNMEQVKDEVYGLLSDLSGIPADEIRKMPFGTTPKMLKEVFDNVKNASFFKELAGLL